MKRGIRILPVMLLIAAMTFVLSGCGPSLEGTWYELEENPDNTGHQLMISDEGTFIIDDLAGEWSISEDTLMLMTPFDAETMTLGETEYGESLIDSSGNIWIKDYDKALEVFTDIEEAKAEQERMEEEERMQETELRMEYFGSSVLAGTYELDPSGIVMAYGEEREPFLFTFNEDGTYEYSCKDMDGDPLTEKGTWEFDPDSFDTDPDSFDTMDIYLTAEEFSSELERYRADSDLGPSESSLRDVRARVLYDENMNKTLVVEINTGMGFSSGEIYLPEGTYLRTE